MLAFKVENLNKSYETFKLQNVSFELETGYIMGFIGSNGAGKTTTLKSILNMIHTQSGNISILGKNFIENELELKQDIGYAFGDIIFYNRSKIKKVTSIIKLFYKNWDDNIYYSYLKEFKIDENKKIDELSQGMKIKYNLAIALSHGAKLFIFDEPTSGLDPVARDNLLDIFQKLVEDGNKSILFSTHITSDLEKCADYITYINNGKIVNSAEKEDFLDTYRLVNGDAKQLDTISHKLISYKQNAFGFTGLILNQDLDESLGINSALPNLEDIMIYYAKKENMNE